MRTLGCLQTVAIVFRFDWIGGVISFASMIHLGPEMNRTRRTSGSGIGGNSFSSCNNFARPASRPAFGSSFRQIVSIPEPIANGILVNLVAGGREPARSNFLGNRG